MITYILYHSSQYDIAHSKKLCSYEDDEVICEITTLTYIDSISDCLDIRTTDYNTFIHDAQQYIEQTPIHISSFRRFIKNTFPRLYKFS